MTLEDMGEKFDGRADSEKDGDISEATIVKTVDVEAIVWKVCQMSL
jgi:hypothetical protein